MPDDASRTPTSVLFADISGSVSMYADRGDTVAFRLNDTCLSLIEETVTRHSGRVIKRAGDAVLAEFGDAAGAVLAAVEMIVAVSSPAAGLKDEGIRVRVGLSYGTVVHSEGDIYGDRVNIAARLVSLAGADEILISGPLYEALPLAMQESARMIDQISLRGHREPMRVFRYLEQPSDATVSMGPRPRGSRATLEVRHGEEAWTVDADHPKLRIGRSTDNDVVIARSVVSRNHAEIVLRGDKFLLVDRSTNGTVVKVEDGPDLRACREELVLVGEGSILLGASAEAALAYRIAES
jgi:adenylate cyclase